MSVENQRVNDAGRATRIAELLDREKPETDQPDKEIASEEKDLAPATRESVPEPDVDLVVAPPESEPEQATIDYDLAIPLGGGLESIRLGQLKDWYQENQEWQTERDSFATERMQQENEQLATRQYLVELASAIGAVDPQVIQRASGQVKQDKEQQRALLMQARPDWADPVKMKAAAASHLALLQEYGIPEALYLSINDHKLIKFIDDAAKLHEQARRGREALKQVPKPPKPGAKPAANQSTAKQREIANNQARNGSNTEKVSAIAALIG